MLLQASYPLTWMLLECGLTWTRRPAFQQFSGYSAAAPAVLKIRFWSWLPLLPAVFHDRDVDLFILNSCQPAFLTISFLQLEYTTELWGPWRWILQNKRIPRVEWNCSNAGAVSLFTLTWKCGPNLSPITIRWEPLFLPDILFFFSQPFTLLDARDKEGMLGRGKEALNSVSERGTLMQLKFYKMWKCHHIKWLHTGIYQNLRMIAKFPF